MASSETRSNPADKSPTELRPQDAGVLSQPDESFRSSSDPADPETLDAAEIERLGRQRPEILPSWFAEAGFVFTIVVSMMMSEYFISGFNIILPAVAEALDIPDTARTWPAAVINLTTACLLMPFSRLADKYGGRIVFLGGHVWLVVWSLISGFSRNTIMLIICRAMQGLGPGAFMPAGLALLGQTYRPGPRKNLVFSLYGAFACIGFYIGIFLGAVSVELLNWRWYFWIGTIICLAIAVSGVFFIPRHMGDVDPNVKMDWLGLVTIVPGLILVVFAFTQGSNAPQGWSTPYVYITLIIGGLLLCAAVYVQGWVSAQPLLPAEIFRPRYIKRLFLALFCAYGVFGLFLFYASF
jgi:MFS family permease